MKPIEIVDALAVRIDQFLALRESPSPSDLFQTLWRANNLDDSDDAATRSSMGKALQRCIVVARKSEWVLALMLFRRIPELPGPKAIFSSPELLTQALVFGTNIIVAHGRKPTGPVTTKSVMEQSIPVETLENVLEFHLWCLIHSLLQFRLNTHVRARGLSDTGFETLIDSYNARANRRFENKHKGDSLARGVILRTASPINVLPDKRTSEFVGPDEAVVAVDYRNHIPFCTSFREMEILFRHLDGGVFKRTYGLTYADWSGIYRTLNAIVADHLYSTSRPQTRASMDFSRFRAAVEREDDLAQSGIAIIDRTTLPEFVFQSRKMMKPAGKFTRKMVDVFFDVHTRTADEPFDDFVETHHCFYEIDEYRVIIDYVRLGALLPVMRRQMTPLLGAAGKTAAKGKSFEELVQREIKAKLSGARGVTRTIKRKTGAGDVFEVDVGFVLGDVLVVVDAKYHTLPRPYFEASASNISNRKNKTLALLDYLDAQVRKNANWLAAQWPDLTVRAVLPIVCTAEPEFIASDKVVYWLEFPEIPRICMLSELVTFLSRSDWRDGLASTIPIGTT